MTAAKAGYHEGRHEEGYYGDKITMGSGLLDRGSGHPKARGRELSRNDASGRSDSTLRRTDASTRSAAALIRRFTRMAAQGALLLAAGLNPIPHVLTTSINRHFLVAASPGGYQGCAVVAAHKGVLGNQPICEVLGCQD